jgi:hypothetical protein
MDLSPVRLLLYSRRGQAGRRARLFADQARPPVSYASNVDLLGAKNKIKIWVDVNDCPGAECRLSWERHI